MRKVLAWCLGAVLGCSSSSDFEVGDAAGDAADDSAAADSVALDTASDAPADGLVDSTTDSTPGDSAPGDVGADALDAGPPCSPTELPALGSVFVSVGSGNDVTGDGTALNPVKTIAKGLLLAKAKPASTTVVLDQGTYPESVVLQDLTSGVVLEGAWKRVGTVWLRVCDANARDLTLVQSPANVAVGVQNVPRSGLRHLTVTTKAVAEVGQTLIGVAVRGSSIFFLDDVVVAAAKGGAGAATPDTPVAVAPTCDPFTGCTTTSVVGANGSGGAGSLGGTFSFDGFSPGSGIDGTVGGNGTNGSPGVAGASSGTNECNIGCSGSGGCNSGTKTTKVGGTGKCGCGGIGGPAGKGGKGGGASLGLFVHGASAVVDIVRSVVTATDGGNGQTGGGGAAPSAPTKGAVGEPTNCYNSGCTGDVTACYYAGSPKVLAGGAAGGDGKTAGKGGDGGGGAGGPSYAIVRVAGGTATLDSLTKLTHGKGGTGGAGAKDGAAGDTAIVP